MTRLFSERIVLKLGKQCSRHWLPIVLESISHLYMNFEELLRAATKRHHIGTYILHVNSNQTHVFNHDCVCIRRLLENKPQPYANNCFFKYWSSLEVRNTARQLYRTVLVTTDELMMRKSNLFFASKSLNDTDYNKRTPKK